MRLTGRLVRALRRTSEGNTKLQLAFCATGAVLVGGLCMAWVVGLTPKPLPPQPPIIPALQPGVPTVVGTTAPPRTPTGGASPTATPGQHGAAGGAFSSASAVPSGSIGPSGTGTGTAAPASTAASAPAGAGTVTGGRHLGGAAAVAVPLPAAGQSFADAPTVRAAQHRPAEREPPAGVVDRLTAAVAQP